jgi:hypothetical protein
VTGFTFVTDGKATWIYDPGREIALQKISRWLFDPLPGASAIAELGFLNDLPQDFLLRDAGESKLDGRRARTLDLKPKRFFQSQLVRSTRYLVRKVLLAVDEESLFPLLITLYPLEDSPLYPLVGPAGSVSIEYTKVRALDTEEQPVPFSPPEGSRVFREATVPASRLPEQAPFRVTLQPLLDAGFSVVGDEAVLTRQDGAERGYATVLLLRRGPDSDAVLTLRIGNFLSPNMGRRRAAIAEKGEAIDIAPTPARLLDRGREWTEHIPSVEPPAHLELGWERDGVHGFLASEGLSRDDLLRIAQPLLGAELVSDGDDGGDNAAA